MSKSQKGRAIPLRLEVENVRAVKKANIVIEGLTVLCGINGTGKSTLARILQDGIEVSLYFDGARRRAILRRFQEETVLLLARLLDAWGQGRRRDLLLMRIMRFQNELPSSEESRKFLLQMREFFETSFKTLEEKSIDRNRIGEEEKLRIRKIVAARLHLQDNSLSGIKRKFLSRLHATVQELETTIDEKLSFPVFLESSMRSPVLWQGNVSISEMGGKVVAYHGHETIAGKKFASIKDVIYIESPLVSDLQPGKDGKELKVEGNYAYLHPCDNRLKMGASDIISESFAKIMHGETQFEKMWGEEQWVFHRDDGEVFPLSEVATGIKAFSLISRLYAYGCLNEDTVLIIDEPEAHLHPQWIAEYAKMLVQLVADAGVRVLVASHSPDMVNALQAFARACRLEKRTHFYQAVPADKKTPFMFKFMDRGMDVGEIFDSFNKVYDAIMEASEPKPGSK